MDKMSNENIILVILDYASFQEYNMKEVMAKVWKWLELSLIL